MPTIVKTSSMQADTTIRSPLLWVPSGYFTMALGYVMLTSVTAIMFKNLGMDNGRAAQYSSMLILAYTIKPLFAPFVEMYRTKKFFVLCAQVLVGLGFAGVALAMGLPDYMTVLMPLFWAMSFIGATQDIASDGVYVTSLDTRTQSLYCGMQSLSWNIGPIVASGVLVYLSGWLHAHVFHHDPSVFGPDWMDAWRIDVLHRRRHHRRHGGLARARDARRRARAQTRRPAWRAAGGILRDSFVTFFQKTRRVADDRVCFPVPPQYRLAGKDRPLLHGRCRRPRAGWACRTSSWASSTAPTAWWRCCSALCWAACSSPGAA